MNRSDAERRGVAQNVAGGLGPRQPDDQRERVRRGGRGSPGKRKVQRVGVDGTQGGLAARPVDLAGIERIPDLATEDLEDVSGARVAARERAVELGGFKKDQVHAQECHCGWPGPGATLRRVTPLDFTAIATRLAAWTFPAGIDGVVGIATGGVVPAALVAQRLGVGMKVIALNFRDDANTPRYAEPKLLSSVPDLGAWRRVLLVDDVYVSGKSWRVARALLPATVEVLPFVFKGQVEFALIRDIEGCVQWPWKAY